MSTPEIREEKCSKQDFTDGWRVILLSDRKKLGGVNEKDRKKRSKWVTRNTDEFAEALAEAYDIAGKSQRIYSTLNERDFNKAVRIFKGLQLDMDFDAAESRERFYLDIKNRWISCLMRPPARKTSYFLIDVDNNEGDDVDAIRAEIVQHTEILLEYLTPNGTHIITKPFNHTLVKAEVKTDGLMLWNHD